MNAYHRTLQIVPYYDESRDSVILSYRTSGGSPARIEFHRFTYDIAPQPLNIREAHDLAEYIARAVNDHQRMKDALQRLVYKSKDHLEHLRAMEAANGRTEPEGYRKQLKQYIKDAEVLIKGGRDAVHD